MLTGLKERLVSSEAVAEAVKAYTEEMNQLNRDRRAQTQTDRKALAKVEKAIAGIIAAIEDGMYQPSMKARMDDLERQKAEIAARMAQAPADVLDNRTAALRCHCGDWPIIPLIPKQSFCLGY